MFKKDTTFNILNRLKLEKLLIASAQQPEMINQIDGVAMGSPLGLLFAHILMSDFERKHT